VTANMKDKKLKKMNRRMLFAQWPSI